MSLHVITGPMFSGKTSRLISWVESTPLAKIGKTKVFKPATDTRGYPDEIFTHDGKFYYPCYTLVHPAECLKFDCDTWAFDEAQFFPDHFPDLVRHMVQNYNAQVIISGLNMNYRGEPFGPMPQLMAMADTIELLQARCAQCNGPATMTYRTVADDHEILIGASDVYEPRCRGCHNVG